MNSAAGSSIGCQLLAHTLDPGVVAAEEEGHVGAQLRPICIRRSSGRSRPQSRLSASRQGGGIARAAAHAGFLRDVLLERDMRTPSAAGGLLQRARRATRSFSAGRAAAAEVPAADRAAGAFRSAAGRTSRSGGRPTAAGGNRRRGGR